MREKQRMKERENEGVRETHKDRVNILNSFYTRSTVSARTSDPDNLINISPFNLAQFQGLKFVCCVGVIFSLHMHIYKLCCTKLDYKYKCQHLNIVFKYKITIPICVYAL